MEVQKDVYVCFVDYEKGVRQGVSFGDYAVYGNISYRWKNDKRMIANLYWNQQASMK